MSWRTQFAKLRALFVRRKPANELADEIRSHLRLEEQENIEAGMPASEARYAALRRFGNVTSAEERSREMWSFLWLEMLGQNIRYGLRQLRRSPGFTIVAVLTLGVGIGANTAIFSAVNAALLRPLPYEAPSRLVYVWSAEKARGINQSTVSLPDLHDWKEQNRVFDGLTGWWSGTYNLAGGDEPRQVNAWTVSPNFFDVFGVRPELGRTFATDEEQAAKDRVVVLSHALWVGSFGANRELLGRTIILDGEPFGVVGVMPAEFSSPFPDVQLWVPWPARAESIASRGDRFLRVIGRLKRDATIASAQADMDTIARRLAQTYPEDAGVTAYLVPAAMQITGSVRPALLVLLGAVGLVLLIACANLANLLLVRSAAREKEFAVRASLGASRAALVRQLLTENGLLAAIGAAVGILLAAGGIRYLRSVLAGQVPRAQDIGMDGRLLLFTLGLAVLTGLGFGLFPALRAFKGQLGDSLKKGGRVWSSQDAGGRVRDLLVIWEMALALMLLVGAGLLLNSFRHLRAIDPGFDSDQVLTCRISLPSTKYKDPQIVAFFQQLLVRLRALPGVTAAGATMTLPLQSGGGFWGGLNIEGHPAPTRESVPIVSFAQVTPGYFRAMGIPLLQGRDFNDADNTSQSPKVAIINATLARRFFSGSNPIGKRICMGEDPSKGPWLSVVGVVGDAALQSLTDPRFPQVFSPHAQGVEGGVAGSMNLVLRTSANPLEFAGTLQSAVHELDKDQAVAMIQPLDRVVSESLAQPRFNTLLLAGFAALALFLGALGVYGLISYSVALRIREIGIRTALGAARLDVLRLVVQHGMILALAGGGIGLVGAHVLSRLMSSLLYGIGPADPPTFVAAFAVLAGVALCACYIPARRATKVGPMVALRYE
ncbi:MAG TPA: ABC transporter permease [Terriglobia bacterium]|nr:ABC transporter permease [Terriglobia bacterium]